MPIALALSIVTGAVLGATHRMLEPGCESDVSEMGGHENVGRRPSLEQSPAHLWTIDQGVLRGSGLVIDAAHIDPGTAIQQEIGNRGGLRFVERLLAISASRVDQGSVTVNEPLQILEPAEPRCDIRRQRRAAGQQESRGVLVRAIEHGKRPVRPVAFQVEIGAGLDQRGQHRRGVPGRRDVRGTLTEVEHRIVDSLPDVG